MSWPRGTGCGRPGVDKKGAKHAKVREKRYDLQHISSWTYPSSMPTMRW